MNKKSAKLPARVAAEAEQQNTLGLTNLQFRINQNNPASPPPAWHLPDVWLRLRELDEWRTFSEQLRNMTLLPQ